MHPKETDRKSGNGMVPRLYYTKKEKIMTAKAKTKKKPTSKPKTAKTAKKPKAAQVASISKAKPEKVVLEKAKPGQLSTKTMTIYSALQRPNGVTVEELAKLTDWKKNSVRGFLSTKQKNDERFAIEKFTRTSDGKTAYKIEEPKEAHDE